jgi:hypothetical protein
MFAAARRFKQLKDRFLTDDVESPNEDNYDMCNMDFLLPFVDRPAHNNSSSKFVFEIVNLTEGINTEKRKVVHAEEQAIKKNCLITTANTVWSSYGISFGQKLATLKTNVACSLRHQIENILFHELNDD